MGSVHVRNYGNRRIWVCRTGDGAGRWYVEPGDSSTRYVQDGRHFYLDDGGYQSRKYQVTGTDEPYILFVDERGRARIAWMSNGDVSPLFLPAATLGGDPQPNPDDPYFFPPGFEPVVNGEEEEEPGDDQS